jgi:hypothetical protein
MLALLVEKHNELRAAAQRLARAETGPQHRQQPRH